MRRRNEVSARCSPARGEGRGSPAMAIPLVFMVRRPRTGALYLRALEERQHHSLVLMKSRSAEAHHLGFKVGSEEDLDKAARFFKGKGLRHAFAELPYQGRTLQAVDPFGMPMEFYFAMEKRERLLQKYDRYLGVH